MTWTINWSNEARKQLRKLDKKRQADIVKYLSDRVGHADHPSDFGKPLSYDKYGLWRYRVGDSRVICQIKEQELLILVLRVGHRKNVYK